MKVRSGIEPSEPYPPARPGSDNYKLESYTIGVIAADLVLRYEQITTQGGGTMTPLRERYLSEIAAQNLPTSARQRYVEEVAAMARAYGRSPDLLSPEQVRNYLVRCALQQIPDTIAAFELLYAGTLGWEWDAKRLMPRPPSCEPDPWGPESLLRRRMREDMQLRNLALKTRTEYDRWVRKFVEFHRRSPGDLGMEEVREYLVHLLNVEEKSASSYGVANAALRFLYANTLRKDWALDYIPVPKREKKLPIILSPEETVQFIEAAPAPKERAIVMTTYAAGLRSNEVARLEVTDIDSRRMLIRVNQGKGRKDRYVMLSPRLLEELRSYWKAARPAKWLFPAPGGSQPISIHGVSAAFSRTEKAAGLTKRVTPRTMRHCFATHLLESGERLERIQLWLGHRALRSTRIYARLATSSLCSGSSPLDLLPLRS